MVLSKKAQINNNIMMAVLLLAVVIGGVAFAGGFGGSSDGLVKVFTSAGQLDDNTLALDDNDKYSEREKPKLTDDVNISQIVDDNGGSAKFSIAIDDDGNYDLEANSSSVKLTKEELEEFAGNIEGYTLEGVWVTKEFDVEGFPKYFQAILLKNTAWNKYQMRYSIGINDFIINNLEKVDAEDLTGTITAIDTYFDADAYYIVGDKTNLHPSNLASVVITENDGGLNMLKTYENWRRTSHGACYSTLSHYLSESKFENQVGGNCNYLGSYNSRTYYAQMSLGELKEYSYDTIATSTDTRTIGFNEISFVKQEITQGVGLFNEKYFKILNNEDLSKGLDENKLYLNEFMTTLIEDNIDLSDGINNPIDLQGSTRTERFEIMTSEEQSSLDYKDVTGLVLKNGYIQNFDGGNNQFIETNVIKFDPDESQGVQFSDLGLSKLKADKIEGKAVGNIKGSNISFDMAGEVHLADLSIWDKIIGSMVNWNDYDFNGLITYATSTFNNPTISNDEIDECLVDSCDYGFQTAFRDTGLKEITFTTEKPVTSLLTYNDEQYWLFWGLDTQSDSSVGCMIFDMSVGDLGVRVPVSICDDKIAGTNSIAQFKIFSED